ncbi:hypothetical protein [Pseudanabaena sp. Chao 1811]|uniref:hypothetical protein n=1 Tax=Pseudanabaena sp. Chao 1811 TaxID=2963092 RepID=UPI0022F3B99B|nr:hypothetical protein [Pseudanabaena sp. Chao 1811]
MALKLFSNPFPLDSFTNAARSQLTGIISFNLDAIAEDDVAFLVEEIKHRAFQPPLSKELYGYHLQPLGIHIEDLGRDIVNFYEELEQRKAKSKPALTSELIAV